MGSERRIIREQKRQVFQQEETCAKKFFPAKPKIDIYGDDYRFRVCAYCRVSTDSDEQLSSFELQRRHYQQLADTHPNWDLLHIYADEGISGTSLKNRVQFNEMIEACREGHYDLIVTKSVSRFARNLVDCISLAREMKHRTKPVGIFFETDNLNTLSDESEFMLAFLATYAQEESVKKHESMEWSLEERLKSGKLLTPELLGYSRPRDSVGNYIRYAPLEIVESEARVVRFIFDAFLAGTSQAQIAAILTSIGCKTKVGNVEWNEGSIDYILRNERYCGNVLTWKKFTNNMFEHTHRKNCGDRNQYLYEEHHPAIISVEKFEAVQVLIENRKYRYNGRYPYLRVIDDGVFRGYLPINHHCLDEDPEPYYQASESVANGTQTRRVSKTTFSNFDLSGYQVARGSTLGGWAEKPAISISQYSISFNRNCLKRFEDAQYIQLLLHPTERKIAIRPCAKTDDFSIRWKNSKGQLLNGKIIKYQKFGKILFRIMNWDPSYQYRVMGIWAAQNQEQIIVFPLPDAIQTALVKRSNENGTTTKAVINVVPAEWGESFGTDFYKHGIQNRFVRTGSLPPWKSCEQGKIVEESIHIPSLEEIQIGIEELMNDEEVVHG